MELLKKIGQSVEQEFRSSRRVLSFGEYMDLLRESPRRQLRNSAQYLRDALDHFGSESVPHPRGEIRRFKLFDAPWDQGEGRLVGQEEVQNEVYRIVSNFVRLGQVNRFILLHGPNGSSKSTITDLLARGLEHYSSLAQGAQYRFGWVFPTRQTGSSGIGFGSGGPDADPRESYAHLDESEVDARLPCELGDHPVLLVPGPAREQLIEELLQEGEQRPFQVSEYVLHGDLCPKCRQIYDALLSSYKGDFLRVLRHVQVERFEVSRRYRRASTRVEPQLAVDARSQQVTADRSLSALPSALQSTSLFEVGGDLVQGNRGMIDFADLLKRPVEAFKYLLTTVEEGRVVLDQANLFFDMLFVGSSNETHLAAFMKVPDWTSFKARMELVRVPYLLSHTRERQIYDDQLPASHLRKHLSPHATGIAALWAVLTRMHRPNPKRFDEVLGKLVEKLTPYEKAELYDGQKLPDWARGEQGKLLRRGVRQVHAEARADQVYEGLTGASPREVRTALLNAAQDDSHSCLSHEAVLAWLGRLVQETSAYDYLRMEPQAGYYDHKQFLEQARQWYLDRADEDLRQASGLVDEASYAQLFSRYINHVNQFVRGEKIKNPITGDHEDADVSLMASVEQELASEGDSQKYRQALISKIGAWSLEHSGQKPDYEEIFPELLDQLRASYYDKQRSRLEQLLGAVLRVLSDDLSGLSEADSARGREVVERLKGEHGYCTHCAREAASRLLRERYAGGDGD